MHRQKTKFSRRVNRVFTHRANGVAKALETRGIRATYGLHDRAPLESRQPRRFEEAPPQLDDVQQGIVAEVEAEGSRSSVQGGLPRRERVAALVAMRDRFVAATEGDLAAGGEHVRVRPGKEFVVRLQSYGVELGLDDPWFRVVARPACSTSRTPTSNVVEARVPRRLVLGAAAGLGRARLLTALAPRLQRQAPPEGVPLPRRRRRGDGPVPVRRRGASPAAGTATRGAGSRSARTTRPRRSWRRGSPRGDATFTAPKGTLIFCNTAGFHRGGFSTTDPRVLATVTYSSPASLASLTVRSFDYSGSLEELDDATRFALS